MNQKFNRIRLIFAAMVLFAIVTGLSSCEKNSFSLPSVDPNQTWQLQSDIQPIFNANCITCHNGKQAPDLRSGNSYNSLTKGGFVMLPGETSILYIHMSTNTDHIPRSSSSDKLKVLYWINQGALNN
jgi:hypothetical protein